jgi:dimethylargininase
MSQKLIAITRHVSGTLGDCELSYIGRAPIDVDLARQQHSAYRRALESCGCRVVTLPAEDDMPDAVFVEDVALVFDEIAIRTRPGAASRRAEVTSVANVIGRYRALHVIQAPGTLDGGDVLRIGRTIYVGESARTNASGIEQLTAIAGSISPRESAYAVQTVPVRGCLHLQSAITEVADGVVLINPEWIDRSMFSAYRQIEIDPAEPHAANALRIGDHAIYPANFSHTQRRLENAGIALTIVDVSELQKAEGAVTCCSLVFREEAARSSASSSSSA